MICPVCGENLRPIQRSGVEIDICPGCKGIWLDRGELDKLIALEATDAPHATPSVARDRMPDREYRAHEESSHDHDRHESRDHDDDRHDNRRQDQAYGQHGARRRGSWLGDILGSFGGED